MAYVVKFIRENIIYIFILLLSISSVLLIWQLSWNYIDSKISSEEARGQFGDKFGAVNALFSGLAFAGLLFTIYLQRVDIIKQRRFLNLQSFDEKFFKMLASLRTILNEAEYFIPLQPKPFKGVDAFDKMIIHYISPHSSTSSLEEIIAKFQSQYHVKYNYYNQYFKELTFIIRYLNQQKLTADQEKFYIDYFKNFMYEVEVKLLALYGVSKYGVGFKFLIEKYRLLSDLNIYLSGTDGNGKEYWSFKPELVNQYPHLKTSFEATSLNSC